MVGKFVQPDSTTQLGATYKGTIDASFSVVGELAAQFAPQALAAPNMTVEVRPGRLVINIGQGQSSVVEMALQTSPVVVAPVGNPRNDLIVIDAVTGALSIVTGTPAPVPSTPAAPSSKLIIGRIRLATSTVAITNSLIDDLRHSYKPVEPVSFLRAVRFSSWFPAKLAKTAGLNAVAKGIAGGGHRWVAVGGADGADAYVVMTNYAPNFWTEQSNPKNITLADVVWNDSIFCAVGGADGTDAYIITSPDGISWTERVNPLNIGLNSLAWNGSIFCAVGANDGAEPYIVTSSDGTTWTHVTNPGTSAHTLSGVCWTGTQFVAVGGQGFGTSAVIYSSPDGATWTSRAPAAGNFNLRSAATNSDNSLIMAVGIGSIDSTIGCVMTSPDGVTWTDRTPNVPVRFNSPARFNKVIWAGTDFVVAMGNTGFGNSMIVSPDGLSYKHYPFTNGSSGEAQGMTYADGRIVAVGPSDGTASIAMYTLVVI